MSRARSIALASAEVRARRASPATIAAPLWLRVLIAIVGAMRWSWLAVIASLPAILAFDLLGLRRREVREGLARIGPRDRAIARAVYRDLATSALELLWSAAHPEDDLVARVRVEGWDAFERARALGRGVVVASAHTGNWDLAACACAQRTRLAVLTKRLSSPALDRFWQSTRAQRGVELIAAPDGDALARVRAMLHDGGAVAILVDQDPRRRHSVVRAPFLGEAALHDPTVAMLAARTKAPIVTAFSRRDRDGTIVVEIEAIETAKGARPEDTTRAIAARLDAFVRRSPTQWLWLHRRWQSARSAT
ncbi:MAG: lysophospholipid acyltransferase family protein [Polyangiales bacterium]